MDGHGNQNPYAYAYPPPSYRPYPDPYYGSTPLPLPSAFPPHAFDPRYNPQPNLPPPHHYPNFIPYNTNPAPFPDPCPPASFHSNGGFSDDNPSNNLSPAIGQTPINHPTALPPESLHLQPSCGPPNWQIIPVGGHSLQASLKALLLHGSLDIWIYSAQNLPNMDVFSKALGGMLGTRIASTLSCNFDHISSMTSDPYVTITVSGSVVGRTYVVSNTENPIWMQHFYVPVSRHAAEVEFLVKDSDIVGSQLMGSVSIPVECVFSGEKVGGVYPIISSNGKPCNPGAMLHLSIRYIPIEKHSMY